MKHYIPFTCLLFLVFLTLKLTGFIAWSWWLVFAPFWAVPAAFIIIGGICLLVHVILDAYSKANKS